MFLLGTILIVLPIMVAGILIVRDGLKSAPTSAEVGIVLGSGGVHGQELSPRLQARLDKTFQLYQLGYFPKIITSGGMIDGKWPEAELMRDYLVAKGVPKAKIWVDPNGDNTFLTAKNTSRMMKDHGIQSAFLVSQYFHIPRIKLAFRRFGITQLSWSHADYFDLRDFYSIPREVIAYAYYWFRAYPKK